MIGQSDIYINHVLLERVLQIKESESLHDDSFKVWDKELSPLQEVKLSQLGRMMESLSKEEIAVVVLIAVQNYPEMVFQILMEEYLINKERKKKNEDSRNL